MKAELSKVRTIQFQEILVGGYFEYRGRRYLKLALSMACDEDRMGNIFHAQTEVLPDPLPQQMSLPENPDSPLVLSENSKTRSASLSARLPVVEP